MLSTVSILATLVKLPKYLQLAAIDNQLPR